MRTTQRRQGSFRALAFTTALAGSLAAFAGPACAQNVTPANPTLVLSPGVTFTADGVLTPAGGINGTANDLVVDLGIRPTSVINWDRFSIANGATTSFTSALPNAVPVSVLNRVTTNKISKIDGALGSDPNVSVWLINPSGIMVGATGAITTGSFVASTLDITPADFTLGNFRLVAGANANPITVAAGATITTTGGNRGLILVAPRITSNGALDAGADRDVAFVTARDVTLTFTPGSPLGITIDEGTDVTGRSQLVGGTVNGRNVYFALASQAGINDALLQVDATVTTAVASDKGIVLMAGQKTGFDADITAAAVAGTSGTARILTTGTMTSLAGTTTVKAGATGAIEVRDAAGEANDVRAGGDVVFDATGTATILGGVRAGDDYTATGASVALGGGVQQRANGAIAITATGGTITGGAALQLRSNADGAGAEALTLATTGAAGGDIVFDATSTIEGGAARQSDVRVRSRLASNLVTLGTVRGRGLLGAIGAAAFAPGLSRTSALVLGDVTTTNTLALTGDGITTGVLTVTRANRDIILDAAVAGAGAIETGALDAGRDILIGQAVQSLSLAAGAATAGRDVLASSVGAQGFTGAIDSGRRVTLTGGSLTATTIDAVRDLALQAATDISVDRATSAAGLVTVNATGTIAGAAPGTRASFDGDGSVSVTTLGDVTLGEVRSRSADVLIQANAVDATSVRAATALQVTAGGTAALGSLATGGGNATVQATGAASVTGPVTVRGDYAVTGDSVALGGVQRATGAIGITATVGTITSPAALTLTSNSDGAGAEALTLTGVVDLSPNSTLNGGTARQSDVVITTAPANALALGTVTANALTIAGGVPLAGAIVTGDVTTTQALALASATSVTTGALTSTGASVSVDAAAGQIDVGAIDAAGAAVLTGGRIDFTTIDAANATLGAASAGGAGIGGTRITAAGPIALIATGGAGGIAIDTITTTAGTLTATSVGNVTLGTVSVTGGATVITTQTNPADIAITTSLTGSDDVTLTATRDVRAPALTSTGGALTIDAAGVLAGAGAGRVTLSAAGLVDASAGTLARLGPVTGGAIDVTADAIDSIRADAGTGIGAGNVRLIADAGGLTVGGIVQGGAVTLLSTAQTALGGAVTGRGAVIVSGDGGVAFTSVNGDAATITSGGAIGGASVSTNGAILIQAGGTATLGSLTTAAGDATVQAVGAASVTGPVTIGGDYSVTGDSVALGGVQSATGAVGITATAGALTNPTALALTANSDDIGAEALTLTGRVSLSPNTTLNGGTARGSDIIVATAPANALALGTVNANALTIAGGVPLAGAIVTGDVTTTQALTLASNASVTTGALISTAGGVSVDAAAGAVDVGAIDAAGAAVLTGGRIDFTTIDAASATLTAASAGGTGIGGTRITTTGIVDIIATGGAGGIAIGTGVTGGGDVRLTSAGDVRAPVLISTGGALTIDAAGVLAGAGAGRVTLSATGLVDASAGTLARLGTVIGGAIDVTADAIDVTSADTGAAIGAGDVSLIADAGALSVGGIARGGALTLSSTAQTNLADAVTGRGAVAITGTSGVQFTGVTGDTITITSGGAIGGTRASGANSLTVSGASVTLNRAASALGAIDLDANAGALAIGNASAATGLTGDATGNLAFDRLTVSAGDATLASGGAATIGNATVSGDFRVTASGLVSIRSARAGGLARFESTGDSVRFDSTTSGGDFVVSADDSITGLAAARFGFDAGGDATLTAGGAITGGTGIADGAIAITGAAIDLTRVNAGSALALTSTGGALTLGTGVTGTTATLDATGALAIVTSLIAGGDATLTATGAASVRRVRSDAGAIAIEAASIAATTLTAATTLDLTSTGGALSLGTGTAGGVATLDATGPLSVTTSLIAGSARVTATGPATIAAIESVAGDIAVTGRSLDIGSATARGALALTSIDGPLTLDIGAAGDGASLISAGELTIGTSLTAGADVTLTAPGDIDAAGLRAGGDLTITGDAVAIGSARAGQALSIRTTRGALTLGTGDAGTTATLISRGALTISDSLVASDAVSTNSIRATDIGTIRSTNGPITIIGEQARIDRATAGGALGITTRDGPLTLGIGSAGGAATLDARGALNITGSLIAGGNVTTTSVTPLIGTTTIDTVESTGGAVSITGVAVDIGSATANGALTITTTDGALTLGTGTAGGAATLDSAGALTITDTLTAAANVTTTATGAADIAAITSTGGDVSIVAPTATIGSASANGALAITTQTGALGLDTGSAGTTATLTAAGPLTIATSLTAGGNATTDSGGATTIAAITSTGGDVTITAPSANVAIAEAGGALTITTQTGALTLGTGIAGGAAMLTAAGPLTISTSLEAAGAVIDTTGTATLARVTAGPSLVITARDAVITGAQRATEVTITNRTPADDALRLGDGTQADGFRLSEAEVNLIDADTVTFAGGSGAIEIGSLAFAADAGRTRVNLLTTGDLTVIDTVSGNGADRTFQFGGAAANETDKATSIRITATADAGGRLLFDTAKLDLRGDRIALGQANLLADLFAGGGLSGSQAATQFVNNANSTLYNALIGGTLFAQAAPTTLSAGTLTVRYTDFALFQNTGTFGLNNGALLGGAAGTPTPGALVLSGPGTAISNSFALFGSINGISGTATAVLGATVIVTGGIDLVSSRVNGCLIGSGAGCLTTTITQPSLNVFDSSRLDIFRSADDFAVPFDPVVGGNNEALFAGVAAIDAPVAAPECDPANPQATCTPAQEEKQ